MSSKPTGGPAFSRSGSQFSNAESGMTLREYFMAHIGDESDDYSEYVKAALIGRPCPKESEHGWLAVLEFEAEFRAKWRAMRADAMLAERGAA